MSSHKTRRARAIAITASEEAARRAWLGLGLLLAGLSGLGLLGLALLISP